MTDATSPNAAALDTPFRDGSIAPPDAPSTTAVAA
jgi:hypothetical protein